MLASTFVGDGNGKQDAMSDPLGPDYPACQPAPRGASIPGGRMMDAEQSRRLLALCDQALEQQSDQRNAFLDHACAGDARLRASVDSLLLAIDGANGFLEPAAAFESDQASLLGRTIGAYRVLEPLGEGGMGAVYLAERAGEDFTQRVALKVIHGHLLARELVARFHAERRILAVLNHPYIARLIDAGATPEGLPYLVMEFVEGAPIDVYCDRERLDIRQRLQLLQKVATAVQAAHQHLIVHRDLKPSNILITEDGIPKLLDFGIAKLLDSAADAETGQTTVFGRRALTPDYASPEQILEGRVTTASDVYSLGVLCFQLVVGSRPYHVHSDSEPGLQRSLRAVQVPRPSDRLRGDCSSAAIATARNTTPLRLIRSLRGDLDSVILQALHRDVSRRYESIEAFAGDLDRYLQGLPVEACDDSIGYRTARFVSRHRIGVAASAGLLLLLISGLLGTGWAWLQAEQARKLADERFVQVRSIAHEMMFDVFDDIAKVPGTRTARESLVVTAQRYLTALGDTPDASVEVRLETARGLQRLAMMMHAAALREPSERQAADSAYQDALRILNELKETHEQPWEVYRTLGELHSARGRNLLYTDNRANEGQREIERALQAFQRARDMLPEDADLRTQWFVARKHLADSYKWMLDYDAARRTIDHLLQDIESARRVASANADLLKVHAETLILRGDFHNDEGTLTLAVEDFRRGIALFEQHLREQGADHQIDDSLQIAYWQLGSGLTYLEKPKEALGQFDHAIDLLQRQLARDPEDKGAQRRLAIMWASKAQAFGKLDRYDDAVMLTQESNNWFEAQARQDSDTPAAHRGVAVGRQVQADLLKNAGRLPEACEGWKRTLEKWLEIDRRFGISEFDAEQPALLRESLKQCATVSLEAQLKRE